MPNHCSKGQDYILNGTIKPFFLDGDRSFWPFLLDGTFLFGRSFWTVPFLLAGSFFLSFHCLWGSIFRYPVMVGYTILEYFPALCQNLFLQAYLSAYRFATQPLVDKFGRKNFLLRSFFGLGSWNEFRREKDVIVGRLKSLVLYWPKSIFEIITGCSVEYKMAEVISREQKCFSATFFPSQSVLQRVSECFPIRW